MLMCVANDDGAGALRAGGWGDCAREGRGGGVVRVCGWCVCGVCVCVCVCVWRGR